MPYGASMISNNKTGVPSHVERFSSFYSSSSPSTIAKALRLAFNNLTELRVDFHEDHDKCKFRGVCWTERGESVPFVARVYRAGNSAPAPFLVEVQRRCGDSVSFFRLYQKLLSACAHVCTCPFDGNSQLSAQLSSFAPLPLPPLPQLAGVPVAAVPVQALLDTPCVNSLCSMLSAPAVEPQREASRCLFQAAQEDQLPLPCMVRSNSTCSTASSVSSTGGEEASAALWAALVHLLHSQDAECARLGAAIIVRVLKRNTASALLAYLEHAPSLLQLLSAKASEAADPDDHSLEGCAQRDFRRSLQTLLHQLHNQRNNQRTNALPLRSF